MSITINDIVNRMKKWDEKAEAIYQSLKEKYPDIDNIIPVVIDPIKCIVLKKGSSLTPIQTTQEVVNAIRLRSLKHVNKNPNLVCVKCEIKYDDYGYIVAAFHYWMPIEDVEVTLPDGTKQKVEGLRTKLAKGEIEAITENEVVFKRASQEGQR